MACLVRALLSGLARLKGAVSGTYADPPTYEPDTTEKPTRFSLLPLQSSISTQNVYQQNQLVH